MSNYQINLTKDTRAIRRLAYLVRWYGEFDVTIGKQKRYSKSFARRKDADRFVEQLKEEFEAGMPRDVYEITIKELCDKFISTRKNILSKTTIDGYDDTINLLLKHFCPTVSIKKIRQEDAEEFVSHLSLVSPEHIKTGKDISDSTRSRHLRHCKKLFQTAVEWNYLKKSPFENIKSGKIRKQVWHYISPEEFRALLGKTKDLRTQSLYTTMYYCGLRAGEAVNLLWDGINIDFEKNKITVVNRPAAQQLPPSTLRTMRKDQFPCQK